MGTRFEADNSGNLFLLGDLTLGGRIIGQTAINSVLPDQSGQSGKILGTNGVTAEWVENSGGASFGVAQIIAGTNITIDPAGGTGTVTINATGGVGATGPTGPEGPAGPAGSIGATGPAGADGVDGVDGATGPAGPTGATGATGPTGGGGEPGGASGQFQYNDGTSFAGATALTLISDGVNVDASLHVKAASDLYDGVVLSTSGSAGSIQVKSADHIVVAINSSTASYFESGLGVGVSPATTFHVGGTGASLRLYIGAPAIGQVLTATSVDGDAAWADASLAPVGNTYDTLRFDGTGWSATSILTISDTVVGISGADFSFVGGTANINTENDIVLDADGLVLSSTDIIVNGNNAVSGGFTLGTSYCTFTNGILTSIA